MTIDEKLDIIINQNEEIINQTTLLWNHVTKLYEELNNQQKQVIQVNEHLTLLFKSVATRIDKHPGNDKQ